MRPLGHKSFAPFLSSSQLPLETLTILSLSLFTFIDLVQKVEKLMFLVAAVRNS